MREEHHIACKLCDIGNQANYEAYLVNDCRLFVYFWCGGHAEVPHDHYFWIPQEVILQDVPCGQNHSAKTSCSSNNPHKEGLSPVVYEWLCLDIDDTKYGNTKASIGSVQQGQNYKPLRRDADGVMAYVGFGPFWERHSGQRDAQYRQICTIQCLLEKDEVVDGAAPPSDQVTDHRKSDKRADEHGHNWNLHHFIKIIKHNDGVLP